MYQDRKIDALMRRVKNKLLENFEEILRSTLYSLLDYLREEIAEYAAEVSENTSLQEDNKEAQRYLYNGNY